MSSFLGEITSIRTSFSYVMDASSIPRVLVPREKLRVHAASSIGYFFLYEKEQGKVP